MALKKKGAAVEAAPADKKKPAVKQALTPAQRVAAALAKDKKFQSEAGVIFDPNEPLATADHWVRMPHPWAKLTGVQGIPMGHVTVIQGKPDSGKTTIAMHGMVEGALAGYNVVLIDTEHKFNWKRLAAMGMDTTGLLTLTCETIEDGFEAIEKTLDQFKEINPGVPTIFIWDSLGQTPTDEEMKATARSFTVASAAKVIKKNLRRLRGRFRKENTALVFVNQIYENINALFGNSTKGYGGNGAYYAAALVLECQRIRAKTKTVDKKQVVVGLVSAIKCTKNHLSDVQGAKCEIVISGKGIDQESVKDLGSEDLEGIGTDDEDDDDEFDAPPQRSLKRKTDDDAPVMKNGRVASL